MPVYSNLAKVYNNKMGKEEEYPKSLRIYSIILFFHIILIVTQQVFHYIVILSDLSHILN